jgi:hypothetical protein
MTSLPEEHNENLVTTEVALGRDSKLERHK